MKLSSPRRAAELGMAHGQAEASTAGGGPWNLEVCKVEEEIRQAQQYPGGGGMNAVGEAG